MIIELFALFFIISMAFLFYGWHADDPTIATLGWAFLFIPAMGLSGIDVPLVGDTPGIQYKAGEAETLTYPGNSTAPTSITRTDTYETYQNRLYGIALLFIASMGLWMSITNIKNTRDDAGALPRINWRFYR